MKQSKLIYVETNKIKPNKFRNTSKYPLDKAKVEALRSSIKTSGAWENIKARPGPNGTYEIAYGHHRIEAAKLEKIEKVGLIVSNLTDDQMLLFMGLENLEEYNTDPVMLIGVWESAYKHVSKLTKGNFTDTDVAKSVGWMRPGQGSNKDSVTMNDAAALCSAAYRLIKEEYISVIDLSGLSFSDTLRLVQRASSNIKKIEAKAEADNLPVSHVNAAKKHIAVAAQSVARRVRSGEVSTKQLRNEIDNTIAKRIGASKQKIPLFAIFSEALINQINRMLREDSAAEKLQQIVDNLNNLELDEDRKAVRSVDFALAEKEEDIAAWRKKLCKRGKVVPFPQLVKQG